MKTALAVGALLLVTASPSPGADRGDGGTASEPRAYVDATGYRAIDLHTLHHRFMACLDHDVEGIVLGGLREAACAKLSQPEADLEAIADRVNELVLEGATPTIRYRAFITGMVMMNPWMFREEAVAQYESDDAFYGALAKRLQESVLAEER